MNAAIALCHFCEAHGPCAIFCTQTLRDTKIDELQMHQQQIPNKLCSACNSLGQANGIYSKDSDSETTFLSTQLPMLIEVASLIKQASVRSLSCEINCNKDGGFVFFGDSSRGHVLSHTFHVSDLQARGFYQLFSIIILMKDKYFLLNIKPFLAEHLKKISVEIQNAAQKIKESEEAKGTSRRCLSSNQVLVQTPRSLVELTGEKNIFAILHSHFSWILLAGSRFITEHVTFGNLPWLLPQSKARPQHQQYSLNTLSIVKRYEDELDQENFFSLRHIKQLLRKEYSAAFYCALIGIKIIVRGSHCKTFNFMMCLKKLLPEQMHNLIRIDAQQHATNSEYKIISVDPSIAVPVASSSVFRIDFLDNNEVSVKWPGELPSKCPDLLTKLIKAVDELRFTELVLNKQTKVLIEEWKNKAICVSRAKSSNGLAKLSKVLGIQPHDQSLINYWSYYLQ